MNPIQHLLAEHGEIMADVDRLRAAARALAERGEAALAESLPVLLRFGDMMHGILARHALKEDEALFPAMEAVFGAEGTPTVVMRREHQAIHAQGELLRRTLHELNQVEHPAIEAGGARLRALTAAGDATALAATAGEIIQLTDAHFGKEEQILFPMAENILDSEAMQAVGDKMEKILRAQASSAMPGEQVEQEERT